MVFPTGRTAESFLFRKNIYETYETYENLRKPAKTVGMRMEVCYNITCIWLRIFDEIITGSGREYFLKSSVPECDGEENTGEKISSSQ